MFCNAVSGKLYTFSAASFIFLQFAVNPEKFSLGKGDSEAPDLLSAIEVG